MGFSIILKFKIIYTDPLHSLLSLVTAVLIIGIGVSNDF